jgi:DNA topoisomerase-1
MKKLLIVESPAKIKTIKKFLGPEFKIMSTMGHIKDLPPKKLGVTINGEITIDYVTIENKEKVIADICKEARTADEVFLAPDPDREGEIIAWHIGQDIEKVLKKNGIIHRITFNEITKNAIQEAIAHPYSIDLQKVAAQQARRVLDRWVGYEVSPVLWRKLAKGLSAGRVQSVALRLIVDREKAIQEFKPEEYWSIEGIFKHNKDTFAAMLTHIGKKKQDIKDQKTADTTVAEIKKESYVIDSIEDKNRNKNPLPPFMTSTLQQSAYNQLGFSVKKTMQVAQQLYEGVPLQDPTTPVALITYMRTDSLRVADSAISQVRSYITKEYSKEYLPTSANGYEKKSKGKAQDAHEAVRPIDVHITPSMVRQYTSPDVAKLYELIWKRFVASQMKSALYAQRTVTVIGGKFTFKVTGSTLLFDGFLKVYSAEEDEKEEKVILPSGLESKKSVDLTKVNPKQHFTQPPARYTEASLVKELEKEGIGRPSTYAAILNTIRERSYTKVDTKKRFSPTELGVAVTNLLVDNLPKIMDPKFTAHMEEDLDKIAQGELDRDTLLKNFYGPFRQDLDKFLGEDGKSKRAAVMTDVTCPECKKEKLNIRFGKSGEFLGCAGFPECAFTANFKRNDQGEIEILPAEKPQLLEETCPQCGKPLRQVQGKFGAFIACSGYPECKYIKQEKAEFKCPLDKGDVVRRAWRGGHFWGCSNYPKCKFAIFDELEMTKCPSCKWPFMAKKTKKDGTVTIYCANKDCPSKKE